MSTIPEAAIRAALAELREEYVAELPSRLSALREAVQRARSGAPVNDVRAIAHKLCGTSGSYGFTALSDASRKVEDLAGALAEASPPLPESAWGEIDAAIAEIDAVFADIRGAER